MSTEMSKILLIGLPETGKTTFLAALWHVVWKSKYELKLKELPAETDYIKEISSKWVDCSPIGRTVHGTVQLVEMKLEDSHSKEIYELIFPDLSGETFNNYITDRRWPKEYDDLVSQACGILLFIHPDKVSEQPLIAEAGPLLEEIDREVGNSSNSDANEIPWGKNKIPHQVKIVDLLQFHADHKSIYNKVFKIAVIISAWDLVAESISPKQWFEKRLPLLDQYLKANIHLIKYTFFGVSAQGGDIDKDKDELLSKLEPYERIIVKDNNNNNINICEPILWIKGN